MKSSGLFFLLIALMFSQVGVALPPPMEPFRSGPELRDWFLSQQEDPLAKLLQNEIGDYVQVPLDYKAPEKGTTSVYYFTRKKFDSSLPTAIYFPGGPGGSGHLNSAFDQLQDWNFIFMDYRGISFSYPANLETLRETRYFTSENVARDAHQIVQKLGVDKVSVYGGSYGTVTATIFAHLFPQITRSLILEGVVYQGDENLWSSSHRQKILQKFFDRLEPQTQEKILAYSQLPGANPAWFSRMAQTAMYEDDYETTMTRDLEKIFSSPEEKILEKVKAEPDDIFTKQDSIFFSSNFFHHIACKELSGLAKHASFNFVFENRRLVPGSSPLIANGCAELKLPADLISIYQAEKYPLSVPVFYIQGTLDGATTAPSAISHYKKIPRQRAQLFLVKGGGHAPWLTQFLVREGQSESEAQPEKKDTASYLRLMRSLLQGQQIPKDQFHHDYGDLKDWKTTLK